MEEVLADPRIAEAGFVFDVVEKTMYPDLVDTKIAYLQQLSPDKLDVPMTRINENQMKLLGLYDSFTPQARKPIEEAFLQVQNERQGFFEAMLRERGGPH